MQLNLFLLYFISTDKYTGHRLPRQRGGRDNHGGLSDLVAYQYIVRLPLTESILVGGKKNFHFHTSIQREPSEAEHMDLLYVNAIVLKHN